MPRSATRSKGKITRPSCFAVFFFSVDNKPFLKYVSPPQEHVLADDEVVVGTFHFWGTCVGLQHNHAGQRLQDSDVVHTCSWGLEENSKGPDGRHAMAFYKPGSASLLRRRSKTIVTVLNMFHDAYTMFRSTYPDLLLISCTRTCVDRHWRMLHDLLYIPPCTAVGYLKQRMAEVVVPLAVSGAIVVAKCNG